MTVQPLVSIVVASPSDLPQLEKGIGLLNEMGVPHEMLVASAHRSPARVIDYASTARERGVRVIIAAAGLAAHLAGAIAAHTTLPVIGIPMEGGPLHGLDALLSTVQMPPGIPVATMAIGKPGAVNAVIFAIQILAVTDEKLQAKLAEHRVAMAKALEEANEARQ
jgi:phosphoribosylaminoimidazole carboxylase PurE protein